MDPLKSLSHPLSLGPPGVQHLLRGVGARKENVYELIPWEGLPGSKGATYWVRPMAAKGWPTMGQRCRDFSPSNARQLLERVPFPTVLGSGPSNEPLGASGGGVILTE